MEIFDSAKRNLNSSGELLRFFMQNKRWWLVPMITILLVLGVIILVAESSAIAPFIYALF
jgi:uncharacterized membrane protein